MSNPQVENGYTRIANEILDALCKTRIRGEYRQVFDTIIRKTFGYQRKSAEIPTQEFVQITGIKAHGIHKARKWLREHNFISVTQKGHTSVLTYSIQKNYTKWLVSPKKVTVTQKGNRCNPKRSQSVTQKGHTLINKERKKDIKKEAHSFFEDNEFSELWNSFVDMRKTKRAVLTDNAIKLIFKKLDAFGLDKAKAALEMSIERGYTGVFEPKDYTEKPKQRLFPDV